MKHGNRRLEDTNLRMRNARQSAAASSSARVSKHQVDVCGHGGLRISEDPRGEYRLLEVPICEHAMRGSPQPHPALLVFHGGRIFRANLGGPGGECRLLEVPIFE